jgi:fatty-acid desaturase
MKVSHNVMVRSLQIITTMAAIPTVTYAISTEMWGWLGASWIAYLITGIMGINVGMHRWLSHGAFKTYRPVEWFMMFCGVVTTTGSPIAWSVVHRLHHKFSDGENDPHSPVRLGWWKAWFGVWNISGFKYASSVTYGISKDPMLRFFHDNYNKVLLLWVLILFGLFGWEGVAFLYCIPAVLSLHSANGIIVIPHFHGYRLFDTPDSSRNSWIANIVTMGEGWHNTHHAHPTRWNTRINWWEWDLPAQIIKLIRRRE